MRSSSATRQTVKPPDKGSFPLDKEGKCKSHMQELMSCLKANKNNHFRCKYISKQYLECRMDQGLMQHENLDTLGFSPEDMTLNPTPDVPLDQTKERKGFISGLNVKKRADT